MKPTMSKASVMYRPATLGWFTGHRCETCIMYRPKRDHPDGGACTLVQGQIEAAYVCNRWAPKQGST